jgi:hypothetical protein
LSAADLAAGRGWDALVAQHREAADRTWVAITSNPRHVDCGQHPLKASLGSVMVQGRARRWRSGSTRRQLAGGSGTPSMTPLGPCGSPRLGPATPSRPSPGAARSAVDARPDSAVDAQSSVPRSPRGLRPPSDPDRRSNESGDGEPACRRGPVQWLSPKVQPPGWPSIYAAYLGIGSRRSRAGSPYPTFDLAPGGVCRATPVARDAGALLPHRFTLTCAPEAPSAVCSLWHFPAGRPDWPLASTLPCGAPTFLDSMPRLEPRPPGRLTVVESMPAPPTPPGSGRITTMSSCHWQVAE